MPTSLTTLADYMNSYTTYYPSSPSYGYTYDPVSFFFSVALTILAIAGMWKVFVKAKQPGWAAIIPIYNVIVLLKIVNRPLWWFFLFLVPFVNFIMWLVVNYDLAKSFGKDVGMMLLLTFLPFIGYPMLGFGDAKYKMVKR